jgi:cell wall-associated NlpC family hydrolase
VASTRVSRPARALFISAAVTGALVLAPLAANALPRPQEPTPTTSQQVSVKLTELAKDSEKLSEQLNQAQIDVVTAQRAAARAAQAAAAAQLALHSAQHSLAVSLASQYKAASFSRTAALLASNSTEGYLQTVQSLNLLTAHQSEVALRAAKAIDSSNQAAKQAKDTAATAVAKRAVIAKRRADLTKQIAKYKGMLATLTAAERARYLAEHAPSPRQVAQVLAAPLPKATPRSVSRAVRVPVAVLNAPVTVSVPSPAPARTSSGAGAAIAAARAQLGKPYAWGASGPGSFDCSGLTAWAWRAAGVNLPHSAAAQQGLGSPVSRGNLQPGDLVFFGSPAYHVAMYLGSGLVIHAPTTGDVVKIVSLSYLSDYSGASRVG